MSGPVPHRKRSRGNCWENAVVYACRRCGKGELCDVCHLHDEPRGSCSVCPRCAGCVALDLRVLSPAERLADRRGITTRGKP